MSKYNKLTVLIVVLGLTLSNKSKAAEETVTLPQESRLVAVNGHKIHLREVGRSTNTEQPILVLLSGPTDNWHSDSAWWVLAQHYLAENYQTVAIDRAGQAWSETIENPSYRQFADDLEQLIEQDMVHAEKLVHAEKQPLIIIAFASSNLSVNLLLQQETVASKVQGVILIDPDVLTEHSIQHYTSETEGYKSGWAELEAYIRSGKYDERIQQKLLAEREHLKAIIKPEYSDDMDWHYYEANEALRSSREFQINKFREASVYLDDLDAAKATPLNSSVPLVVLDTDFESAYLEQLEDEKVKATIAQWRKEGIEWYFELAQRSECGAYWPVDTQEHLLMMTQPQLIEQAVERIMACPKIN